jgi:hypothetical protein
MMRRAILAVEIGKLWPLEILLSRLTSKKSCILNFRYRMLAFRVALPTWNLGSCLGK